MSRSRSSSQQIAVLALLLVLAVGLFAPVVSGHAYLGETNPDQGEQLEEVPDDIELLYTGDGIQSADVSVTGPDGSDVSAAASIDPDDTREVTVPLEVDAGNGESESDHDGMYIVEWEVLADDGHTTTGTFFFAVGDEELDRDAVLEIHEDGEDDDDLSALEFGSNALVLLSLVGLVGVPVTMWASVYPAISSSGVSSAVVDRRAKWLLAGASLAALVGVLGIGVARSLDSDGSLSTGAFEEFLETSLGSIWVAQLVLATLVAAVLLSALRWRLSRRRWLPVAAVGGTVVALSVSWTSHSATMIGRLQGVITDGGHVGGAALWVGGLVTLALVVPGALSRAEESNRRRIAATAIERFSLVALVGVTLALTSGLILAAWHVPDIESLRETLYGTALSAKTALVALALGLGGFARFVVLKRLRRDSESAASDGRTLRTFVRGVRFELGVLLLVIVLSGLLTTAPTAALAGGDDGPGEATIEIEGDDVDLELVALPGQEAAGMIQLEENEPVVFDATFLAEGGGGDGDEGGADGADDAEADDRQPASADDPSLTFHHDDQTLEVDLEENDDGTYSAVQALPDAHEWELRIDAWVGETYVSEWVDVYVVPDGEGGGHDEYGDNGADHDHDANDGADHDGESGDHEHHDHDEHATDDPSPLTVLLQFGAVAVAVVGSVAVAIEATRVGGDRN
ncbi:copper resistance CopC/CopD family protein [Halostagnicola bangensis]